MHDRNAVAVTPAPLRARQVAVSPLWRLATGPAVGPGGLGLALTVVLSAYAFRGWFARYTADDYCTAGIERAAGFLQAQAYWYESWSGRFTYYIVSGLVEYAGTGIVQVLPGAALIAFVGVGAWALMPVAAAQRWPVPILTTSVLSAALVVACLQGAPNLEQALYWQTGMLTYLLPLVLLTFAAGWLVRRIRGVGSPSRLDVAGNAALLFAIAGLSETTLAVQLTLLPLGALFALLLPPGRRRPALVLLTTGWAATIIAAVIFVAAPGNYRHEVSLTGSVRGLGQVGLAVHASAGFAGLFARSVEFRARTAVLVLLCLSVWFGLHAARAHRPASTAQDWLKRACLIVGTVICGWVLLVAAAIPGYFAQGWDPPERAQFVAVWLVAVGLAVLGCLIGEIAGQVLRTLGLRLDAVRLSPVWTAACLVLAVGSLFIARGTLALVPADAAYAADWDMLDTTIRTEAASGGPVVVPRTLPNHYGFDFLTTDPAYYPNPCVAQFYGVPSIRVAE
jgi:Family of unknown function (DUF6056)